MDLAAVIIIIIFAVLALTVVAAIGVWLTDKRDYKEEEDDATQLTAEMAPGAAQGEGV